MKLNSAPFTSYRTRYGQMPASRTCQTRFGSVPAPAALVQLVADADTALSRHLRQEGKPAERSAGNRLIACIESSHIVQLLAQRRYLSSRLLHTSDAHSKLPLTVGAQALAYPKQIPHYFNLITVEGKPYLVDLTVGQFVRPDGHIEKPWLHHGQWVFKSRSPRRMEDYPVIQELIEKGYAPATPENLADYFFVLCDEPSKQYRETLLRVITMDPALTSVENSKLEKDVSPLLQDI